MINFYGFLILFLLEFLIKREIVSKIDFDNVSPGKIILTQSGL